MVAYTYKEEIRIAKRMLGFLEGWTWTNNKRLIRYDIGGKGFRIEQLSTVTDRTMFGSDAPEVANTMYYRTDVLHRLDGPAYIFYNGQEFKKYYFVDGTEYNKNEFNFFIKGMVK